MSTKRLKIVFFILTSLTLIVLIAWVAVLYLAKLKVGSLAEEMREQTTFVGQKDDVLYLQKLLQETQSGREVITAYFFKEDRGLSLIEKIGDAAKAAKVTFKIDRAEETQGLKIHFSAEGSFKDLSHFLVLIENLPYHARLEGVSLMKNNLEGRQGLWSGDFVISSQE